MRVKDEPIVNKHASLNAREFVTQSFDSRQGLTAASSGINVGNDGKISGVLNRVTTPTNGQVRYTRTKVNKTKKIGRKAGSAVSASLNCAPYSTI
jgi:hypothetical protein